jgi:DNA replication and repair protein RecF
VPASLDLRFERVVIRGFRNLTQVELELAPRLNVVSGDNGQGKTSLIEALYLVATSKSFRADKTIEMLQHGAEQGAITARVNDTGLCREQRAVLRPTSRTFFLDGKRAPRLASYAVKTPVVVFHPGDLGLASGPATLRRLLLDRVALFMDPSSADHRARYAKAIRERQRALAERGTRASELDAYEALAADDGAGLQKARARAAERVVAALGPAFGTMAAPDLDLRATFRPGGSEDPMEMRRQLAEHRPADLRRGSANYGPHRDELELDLAGRSARRHGSQGQQRILAVALKLAELECVREARGVGPVLLLDDVTSELDPSRADAVYTFLSATSGQVFATTPRPERLAIADSVEWIVRAGQVTRS